MHPSVLSSSYPSTKADKRNPAHESIFEYLAITDDLILIYPTGAAAEKRKRKKGKIEAVLIIIISYFIQAILPIENYLERNKFP